MGGAASAARDDRVRSSGQRNSQTPSILSENGSEDRAQSSEDGWSFSFRNKKPSAQVDYADKSQQDKLRIIGPSRHVLGTLETKQAASIDAHIDEELTPTENAANIIELLLKENARRYDAKTKAGLNFALGVLKLGSAEAAVPEGFQAITNGEATTHVDVEMQEWLRANFTPEATGTKSAVDARSRFRKAGLGIFAAENILKGVKTGPVKFPALPIEIASEEEVQIKAKLEGVDRWDWNIFALEEVCKPHILEITAWRLLLDWDLPAKFHISPRTLQKFLAFVQSNYSDTEYHNATHAADVLQSVHYMLRTAGAAQYLSEVQILAMLLGAICHDLGHDGYNNLYHKNKVTERALQFNDQSIQENFHAKTLFLQLHQSPEMNIFQNFNENQVREMRRMLIDLILATDMTKHFTMMADLRNEISRRGTRPESWGESQGLLMQGILHTCDISNPAKPRPLCEHWTDRVLGEFFKQGDQEKAAALPISPQCNRETTSRATSQMGFIHFIVEPSFQGMAQLLPALEKDILPTLAANMKYWVEVAESMEGIQVQESFKGPSHQRDAPTLTPSPKIKPTAASSRDDKEGGEGRSGEGEAAKVPGALMPRGAGQQPT